MTESPHAIDTKPAKIGKSLPIEHPRGSESLKDLPVIQARTQSIGLLTFILIVGALLRFYQIGTESYWIDEMYTVVEGQQSVSQLLQSGRLDQPPAYYLPFRIWIQLFSASEVSTRSFSAIIGLVCVAFVYWIGKELFSTEAGLLSAFLMAISEFQIMYSQQARYYTFFELMTILSFLFLILALRRQKKLYASFYVLSSVLMIYSHAFGVFILAAQNLYFLLQFKNYRHLLVPWLIGQALIVLGVIPYFYPLFLGSGVVEEAISNTAPAPPPKLWQPLNSIYRFIMPLRFEQSWATIFGNYFAAFLFLGVSVIVYAWFQGWRKWFAAVQDWIRGLSAPEARSRESVLMICWLAIPLLLPFIMSWVVVPIFNHRYNIGAAPALYLLLALFLLQIRKIVPVMLSLGALIILIVPGLNHYYETDINQQWRETTQYVAENAAMSNTVVFPPHRDVGLKSKMMEWYTQETLLSCGLNMQRPDIEIWSSLRQCTSEQDRFWVVYFTDEPVSSPVEPFFLGPDQTQLRLLEKRQFVEITVYLFEWME